MKTVSLLHPFTPKAAGVVEKSVVTYHSQPHCKAMQSIANEYDCKIEYFTSKLFKYSICKNSLKWNFYPVSYKLNGDHTKWKKQFSMSCLSYYKKSPPDLTIINMSGQSSLFSYELSKVILKNKKQYIAMLGGQEYIDNDWIREYYKRANHILVHTNIQKNQMEKMEMFKGLDIRVFPLGVNCNVFKPNDILNNKDTVNLLYVGKIVEWKRVHLAIESLKYIVNNGFDNANLKIIGPIVSNEYYEKLKNFIQSNNLLDKVEFIGHIEHYELPKYFQNADLFLLPSDKETFGMVMIESMSCGTPVAAINCPGGPLDVISNNYDGILSTPENYAQTILALFKNQSLLKEMKLNARKTVIEKYSIEETTRVLKESINFALNKDE